VLLELENFSPLLPDLRRLPVLIIGMEERTATRYRPILEDQVCDCCEEKDGRAKQGFLASKISDRCICLLLVILVASLLTNFALIMQRSRCIAECDEGSIYGLSLNREGDFCLANIPSKPGWL
jgi:hypothetical protein